MGMITGDWLEAVGDEFKKPYYKNLYEFVKKEYSTQVVYPPSEDIFNALHFTALKDVKVLILGQDPYHEPGQAHGLSFSVNPGVKMRITHQKDIHIIGPREIVERIPLELLMEVGHVRIEHPRLINRDDDSPNDSHEQNRFKIEFIHRHQNWK